jgi:tol-pal system protein YbgF
MARIFLLLLLITNIAYAQRPADEELVTLLEQRINELTDQIERINHKYDLLQKKLDSMATDAEFRMKELENKNKKPSEQVEPIKNNKTKDSKSAKSEFEKAFALIKEQQYGEAENAFNLFIKEHPNSEYTGNAYYWLAETFMLRKNYNKAAINYIQSFNKFPKNNKADLSMLKLASALNSLEKKKEACDTLNKLKLKKASLNPALQKLLQKENQQIGCDAK